MTYVDAAKVAEAFADTFYIVDGTATFVTRSAAPAIPYGTIRVVRSTEVPSPTISVYAWFACWHTYSKSSVPSSQRRFDVPVKRFV